MFSLVAFFVWNRALAVPCCMCFPMALIMFMQRYCLAQIDGDLAL